MKPGCRNKPRSLVDALATTGFPWSQKMEISCVLSSIHQNIRKGVSLEIGGRLTPVVAINRVAWLTPCDNRVSMVTKNGNFLCLVEHSSKHQEGSLSGNWGQADPGCRNKPRSLVGALRDNRVLMLTLKMVILVSCPAFINTSGMEVFLEIGGRLKTRLSQCANQATRFNYKLR
ncbi:hypothetical protein [Legionella sp. 16cNR16C]|uniref:hypothetical protein n=1 Tax=Legionella sp. 16cNR16C TaxID=2905656 RepID=UPI001E45C4FA|nr:hypothetical protein [Legionella sp. 16cNR16C]MCE3044478.1 hypothetical protein [Legionella sp. 16cNR16C]